MSKEDLHIDDFFQRELKDLAEDQETPSWATVSRSISRKRSEKRLFHYSAAAAGLLLLAGGTLFLLLNHNDPAAVRVPSITTTNGLKETLRPAPQENYGPTDNLSGRHATQAKPTGRSSTAPVATTSEIFDQLTPNDNIPTPPVSQGVHAEDKVVQETQPATPVMAQSKDREQQYLPPNEDYTSPRKNTFHTGILIGYQKGFQANTLNAPVISSMFQLDLGDKLSLSIQPTLAYNKVQKSTLSNTSHSANVATDVHQASEITPNGIVYHHNVNVTYDSLNVAYVAGSGFWQAELPLYVHYKVAARLSVFTGAAVRYTGNIGISEQVRTTAVTSNSVITSSSQYLPQGTIDAIVQQSVPGGTYDPSAAEKNISSGASTVSVLYGLGVQYQVSKRIGLEILGNKNLSGFKQISNKEVKSLHQQPNLRISILYNFRAAAGK